MSTFALYIKNSKSMCKKIFLLVQNQLYLIRFNLFTVCCALLWFNKIPVVHPKLCDHFCVDLFWIDLFSCELIFSNFEGLKGSLMRYMTVMLFYLSYLMRRNIVNVSSTHAEPLPREQLCPGLSKVGPSAHTSDVTWTTNRVLLVFIAAAFYLYFTGQ